MGGGSWDASTYASTTSYRKAAGIGAFDYSDKVNSGRAAAAIHEMLDPKKKNSAGVITREALDTDEHPESTPVAVFFDVTGSMGGIPKVLQKKLPELLGALQRKGYVPDPQILFGAVGDGISDRFPLQVGQFESDNRLDETLGNIILEGGGGGGNHESYELAAYFMARYSNLGINTRGGKGFLFFIGDERLYGNVSRRQVEKFIGEPIQEDIPTEEIFRQLQEKYEVFFLFAEEGSYNPGEVLTNDGSGSRSWWSDTSTPVTYWRDLLGQNALRLEDANAVCETIAMTLAIYGGGLTVDDAAQELVEVGSDAAATKAASRALASLGVPDNVTAKNVAVTTGVFDIDAGVGTSRL